MFSSKKATNTGAIDNLTTKKATRIVRLSGKNTRVNGTTRIVPARDRLSVNSEKKKGRTDSSTAGLSIDD